MEAIVMYAIANEKADPLTKHKPDIPDDLQMIVDKALQKRPEDRYQTISEMATDLGRLKSGTSEGQLIARASEPSRPTLSLKRKIIYAAMVVLILAAAALFFINPFSSSGGKLKRVVVVPFKNQTGNAALDPLGRMVADWTTHGLAQSGMVETVPLEKVPDLEKKESIKDVVSATGANIIVMGSYYQLGDSIRFQAKIVDKDDKLLQAIDPISSLSEKAMDGVEGVHQKVMGTLAMLSEQRFGRLYSKPPIYEAYLQYIQGLDIFGGKTDKGVTDWTSSIRYFEKAYSLDSSFFSPLFYIFAAHINLGQIAQADSVLQFLTIRRDHLSQMEQLDLEEYRCIISGDAMKALNVARERAKIAPGTGTYYRWGRAAFMAHRPRECIQVLKRIDSEDSLAGIYTWIFLCDAFHFTGDYKNALKTAKLGRRLYPASSNFLIHEIRDLAAMGRVADLRKVLEEAAEYDQGRDIGINMLNAAQDLRVHGHEDTAMAIYNEATRWYEHLSPEDMKLNRLVYGQALYGARRWQEAIEIFEELDRGLADSLDPPEEILTARIWIGTTAARLGDRHRALEISEWLGNIKQTYRNGGPSYNRACIAAILGDKERAVNFLKESAAQGYFALGRWMITDWDFDLESLRDYPPFQEFIRPKG
jgi:TolB-like protein